MRKAFTSLLLAGAFILLSNQTSFAQDRSPADHGVWDGLLKEYVDADGWVDYKGFMEKRLVLHQYLTYLSENKPEATASQNVILAFYINLYNAAMVDRVLEHYPIGSVKDIKRVWGKKLIPLGEELLSLNDIEHGILRKLDEPRIHFAVNCASVSCPKLMNSAFVADRLEEQLDTATKAFLNSDKNQLDGTEIGLSKLFSWYKKDFVVAGVADPLAYINQYLQEPLDVKTKTYFLEYDWNLNEQGQ